MTLSRSILLVSLCLVHLGLGKDSPTAEEKAWRQTMLAARGAFAKPTAKSTFTPFVSTHFKARQKAEKISVDISGVKLLWLVCNEGGNGSGADHGTWGDAKITDLNGNTVQLADLQPLAAMTGWRHFQINKGCTGDPLVIAKQKFKKGLWLHSQGYVCYALNGKYRRLESWIGLDDRAQLSGRVGFEVRDRIPQKIAIKAFWKHQQIQFPKQYKWLEKDLSEAERNAWLTGSIGSKLEGKLIQSAYRPLNEEPNTYSRKLEKLLANSTPVSSPVWLDTYLEIRNILHDYNNLVKTMEFCRKTRDMVVKAGAREDFSAELAKLEKKMQTTPKDADTDFSLLDREIRVLRRQIILTHPALDFNHLLINKRPPPTFPHQCDQYLGRHSRPGAGLVILKNWKSATPEEKILLAGKLPPGTVTHPDLSFDGKRILFAYCDHSEPTKANRRFSIYEIQADGSGLRQLTGDDDDSLATPDSRATVMIEDFDPCYLPDGNIVFVSTRCQGFGRCHHRRYNPSYMLYRMDADGNNISQLSFGEANEWDPSVLADGRIIYTRWDYINRHDTYYQSLWTMRPDGTGIAHFYGNYTRNPCMTAEARGIPNSRKVVCTAMAHHAYTTGSIIALDPHRGVDGTAPVERITPEVKFPETEGWNMDNCCAAPWPLTEDLYLVARAPNAPLALRHRVQNVNAYSIWLIDTLGGRELIYADKQMSCFAPIPLQARPKPAVFASSLPANPGEKKGIFYVQDVQEPGRKDQAEIASLRINAIIGQPTASVPHRGKVRQEIVKRIIGTVPVDKTGAAAFEVPSGTPLQLQALDKDGKAVMTMRSFVHVRSGEQAGCVGCHEHRLSAPLRATSTKQAPLSKITPPAGPDYPGGFSYQSTVQPVFDRYCISCHGLKKTAGKVSLLGTLKKFPVDGYPGWPKEIVASESYDTLVHHPKQLVKIAQRNRETAQSTPNDYFANASKLTKFLLDGHCPALLKNRAALSCIFDWLDLNLQYNGDYSWNRPGNRQPDPAGEKALRDFLAKHFGTEFSQQPFAALVNPALPGESRALKATLAISAGGWGQLGEKCWTSTANPNYQTLRKLVMKSLPENKHDLAGTCNQTPCICGCCWVREIRKKRLAKATLSQKTKK